MIRGLYTAVSGMLAAWQRLQVTANNLANVATPGYKQERTAAGSFDEQLVAQLTNTTVEPLGVLSLAEVATTPTLDLAQGPLQATGRDLDIALEGPGFLVVQTEAGVRYTRDGTLARDADGFLTTATGARVVGVGGPIQVPAGTLAFDPDGTVRVDDAPVGQLQLVEFPPEQTFRRVGWNQLEPADGAAPQPAAATRVRSGFIEGSNVDVSGTLTLALALQRAYDANLRLVQYQNDLLQRAVTDIAQPAG